jgi:transposase, IS6 family
MILSAITEKLKRRSRDDFKVNRWVLAYAPLIERRLRAFRKPHCGSVRIDETYIKIRGQWRYLYRAIDKHGTSVDFS